MSKYRTADLERMASIFKALGNAHRLRIVIHLATCCQPGSGSCTTGAADCQPGAQCCGGGGATGGDPRDKGVRSVGELGGGLKIVASTLSHHIKELSRAALMSCQKHGKCVMCCIDRDTLREISALFAALAGDAPLPEGFRSSTKSIPKE